MTSAEIVLGRLQRLQEEVAVLIDMASQLLTEPEPIVVMEEQAPMEDEYMTLEEVAKLCKVSKPTIYRWIDDGCFPEGRKWGARSRRWRKSEVERYDTRWNDS